MKKNITNFIFNLFLVWIIFFLFSYNKEISIVILEGMNLFLTKVFVSLFPMFLLNDILINQNIPYYFYLIFNNIFKKIFKTSGILAYVLIMSLISGTPTNAYILKNLVNNNFLTYQEANHYLYFTYFSNPLFLILMLSHIFSQIIVLKIILSHYLANIIIGIILRGKSPIISANNLFKKENKPLYNTLIPSIEKSIQTLLMILGTIIFYRLFSFILIKTFNFPYIIEIFMTGFLEITSGLNKLSSFIILENLKSIISLIIISFGGISIHTQIKGILEDTNINYIYFLKGRIIQVIISIIIFLII